MSFNLHFQGEELYVTASAHPGMTGVAGAVSQLGSRTVSLTHLLRIIVREEIEAALNARDAAGDADNKEEK